jgi:hypothetical protein
MVDRGFSRMVKGRNYLDKRAIIMDMFIENEDSLVGETRSDL